MSSNLPHEEKERLEKQTSALAGGAAVKLRDLLAKDEADRVARVVREERLVEFVVPISDGWGGSDRRKVVVTYAEAKMLQFELNRVLTCLDKSAT